MTDIATATAGLDSSLRWNDGGEHSGGSGQRVGLGPVNTTDASANEPLGVQGKADDAARTGRPGQEDNAAMRAERFIPSGLPA